MNDVTQTLYNVKITNHKMVSRSGLMRSVHDKTEPEVNEVGKCMLGIGRATADTRDHTALAFSSHFEHGFNF